MKNIPYGRQTISDADIKAVTDVFKSNWLTTGPLVDKFEKKLKVVCKANHVVSCSSGTAALHLAMLSLNIGPDDWVIVPGITFVATANAVRLCGGNVIFTDVDPDTGLMTTDTLKQAHITAKNPDKIKALIVVHLNGQSAQMGKIKEYADTQGWKIIEDACHTIGGTQPVNGQELPIGSCAYSDITVFSFHPVKTITTAEGGALLTNNANIAVKTKQFRSHGITHDRANFQNVDVKAGAELPWYYEQQMLGLNYRLNDIQCALGISQLEQLTKFILKRAELFAEYEKCLSEYAPKLRLVKQTSWGNPAWHLCSILIDFGKIKKTKSELMAHLQKQGIFTQVHFIPVYQQPYYQDLYGNHMLEGCENYYQQQLSLPLFPTLEVEDIKFIAKVLGQFLFLHQ